MTNTAVGMDIAPLVLGVLVLSGMYYGLERLHHRPLDAHDCRVRGLAAAGRDWNGR